jgi:hypothetical protein
MAKASGTATASVEEMPEIDEQWMMPTTGRISGL